MSAIEVSGLQKSYGAREVLHGLSFTVDAGYVFALLGPNGAGKTTTVEIRFRRNGQEVVIDTPEPTRVLHELTAQALAEGRELDGLEVRRPTLEDVYLLLTTGEDE